jgi:predicted PurR-regulated permease PerM
LVSETARRAFVAALVVGSVIVVGLALWKLRLVISLLFFAFIIAAAMRPGVDALARRRIPRGAGVLLHYAALAALIAGFLWLVVPTARDQLAAAIPTSSAELKQRAQHSKGIKHDILVALQKRVNRLPSAGKLVHPALEITRRAFEVLVGFFFVFASAAYWIFERDRVVNLVASLLPRPKRKVVRDTWNLIDLKLGAYVRGQGLLVVFVALVLSGAFRLVGLPFWLLVGSFAGLVELIPVVGPLAAGLVAVSVGLTKSVGVAIAAGVIVLAVRLLEDYVVVPRVLGEAVGLSPLLVLVSVTTTTILFGGFAVLLAIPLAAVVTTLVQVIVLEHDPAEQEVPAVLFTAKDSEG